MTHVIQLNVGGVLYTTTKEVLLVPNSFFARMFGGEMKEGLEIDDALFIDRDGKIFRHVLNYLRNRDRWLPPADMGIYNDLLNEATYFGLDEMHKILLCLGPKTFFIYVAYQEQQIDKITAHREPSFVAEYLQEHATEGDVPKEGEGWIMEKLINLVYPRYQVSSTFGCGIYQNFVFTSTLESNIMHYALELNKKL
jgi:BTB/POZ domain